jgi:hypothetical protein
MISTADSSAATSQGVPFPNPENSAKCNKGPRLNGLFIYFCPSQQQQQKKHDPEKEENKNELPCEILF